MSNKSEHGKGKIGTACPLVADALVLSKHVVNALNRPRPCATEGCEGSTHTLTKFCRECKKRKYALNIKHTKIKEVPLDDIYKIHRHFP